MALTCALRCVLAEECGKETAKRLFAADYATQLVCEVVTQPANHVPRRVQL